MSTIDNISQELKAEQNDEGKFDVSYCGVYLGTYDTPKDVVEDGPALIEKAKQVLAGTYKPEDNEDV